MKTLSQILNQTQKKWEKKASYKKAFRALGWTPKISWTLPKDHVFYMCLIGFVFNMLLGSIWFCIAEAQVLPKHYWIILGGIEALLVGSMGGLSLANHFKKNLEFISESQIGVFHQFVADYPTLGPSIAHWFKYQPPCQGDLYRILKMQSKLKGVEVLDKARENLQQKLMTGNLGGLIQEARALDEKDHLNNTLAPASKMMATSFHRI